MARKSIDLQIDTSPEWAPSVLADFDAFLLDHANCERKAFAFAMSLVAKYPDRTKLIGTLIDLAQEELEHFREVYALIEQRGLALRRDEPDPYIQKLLAVARHGRDERLIDRMLISSVIETRGAERFQILAETIEDEPMRDFYARLWKAEKKHAHQFAHILLKEFAEDQVYPRLQELMKIEAEIIPTLKLRPALH
ncbi:MAG: tRNA-(ms[2]io[6]A)-hydroxylase [Gammaproteobacteria bacterium]|nr:tRNA-(ms[2]io[6]A)-hydroxylase [Gammaproteobacteria bacterium]NND35832.1 tRNA-(ms[2]io[6]A)-hydroxylase [Gammaproteobacteria bacterium]